MVQQHDQVRERHDFRLPEGEFSVPEFLESVRGTHAYNQWSLTALSSAAVVRRFGQSVLEAFEAQNVFLDVRGHTAEACADCN